MRLWSIHPSYLDAKGLVALWREGLLAQNVLFGKTKGYKHHPQLIRFKDNKKSKALIGTYLYYVYIEANKRNYNFNKNKILCINLNLNSIVVNNGQIKYEFEHLKKKLKTRDPKKYLILKNKKRIKTHPLFSRKNGPIESWEVY